MGQIELNDLLVQKAVSLILESEALKMLKHGPLKGSFREMILGNLIKPLLPATCGIFHGTVISSIKEEDDQTVKKPEGDLLRKKMEDDLLIVDKECLPPILYSERDGIFPIESVLARIEVKSTLSKINLKDAINGCKQFRKKLKMNLRKYHDMYVSEPLDNDTFQAVFAFGSRIGTEYDVLMKILSDDEKKKEPPLDCLCVAKKGMLSWGRKSDSESKRWLVCGYDKKKPKEKKPKEPEEILAFLALLLDKLSYIRQQRKEAMLGKYVFCLKSDKMVDAEEFFRNRKESSKSSASKN